MPSGRVPVRCRLVLCLFTSLSSALSLKSSCLPSPAPGPRHSPASWVTAKLSMTLTAPLPVLSSFQSKESGLGNGISGLKVQLQLFLMTCWADSSKSLYLSFLIGKTGGEGDNYDRELSVTTAYKPVAGTQ